MNKVYLAKSYLNPMNSGVHHDFLDYNKMHKTICRISPEGRPLFRTGVDTNGNYVLIQSQKPMDFNQSGRTYWENVQTSIIDFGTISEGGHYSFLLTASPTKRDIKSKKIVYLGNYEEQEIWVRRKMVGSTIHSLTISGHSKMCSQRGDLNKVNFSGILEIIDKKKMIENLVGGIGRSKFAGCGLLSIRAA